MTLLQQAARCWFESCQVEVVPLERCHAMECFTLPVVFDDFCSAVCALEETVRTDEGLVQLLTTPSHQVSSVCTMQSKHNVWSAVSDKSPFCSQELLEYTNKV